MSQVLPEKARRVAEAGLADLESLLASQPPAGVTALEVIALFRLHRSTLTQALVQLLTAAAEKRSPAEREKYPDGRWVARPGDKVYSLVAGFGGSQAAVYGVVEKGRGGLRVRVTGTGGFFPGTTRRKSTRYTSQWTVSDDPRPGELRAERLAREKAQEEQWRREQEEYEAEARVKAAAAVRAGEAYLTEATPPGRSITDHLGDRKGRLMRQSELGPIVRWRGGLEGDSTIGSPNAQGFWPMITVGKGEALPDYLLLLQAEPHPAFNPTVLILPQWVQVENLADAQGRTANFIAVNKVGEGNWKGGAVMRDGEPFAQIRYDGRIFNSLIGGEIDAHGNPIERRDTSLALLRAGGRYVGHSDGPKVAGELHSTAEKRGQKP